MKSVAFTPRESVASTRKVTVTFVAGAVKLNAAVLAVAEAITEGVGPEACDHAYVIAPTPVAAAVSDTAAL
jgi:hypothetical protein